MRMPGRRRLALVAGPVIALLIVSVVVWSRRDTPPPTATEPRPSSGPPTTEEIFAKLAPSLVVVVGRGAPGGVDTNGTGFVASTNGAILTALHLVHGASAIEVVFADGTRSEAVVLAEEPSQDIAIIGALLTPELLVPAVLGGSGSVAVGQEVVALGHQLGLAGSVTTGVVSGVDRSTSTTDGTRLAGLIQFDAAVNPGSSGGPLVNRRGETIGVVIGLANPSGATFIGVGFAVPIGTAVAAGGGGPQQ